MSRIEQLINELCPNGIPYVEISTLFNLRNGYTPRKSNADYWEDGTIPWFRMEDIRDNGRILADSIQKISESAVKGGNLFPANSLLVATSATIGEHALITVPHLSNQRFTSLALKPAYANQLDMKFAFYYGFILAEWCRNNTTMSSFASVDMSKFRRFKFPIPPLEVQCEIVKILDTFSELEVELEAELGARQQQYEYYRQDLLKFDQPKDRNNVRWLPLADIAKVTIGEFVHKSKQDPEGLYPVYNGGRSETGYYDKFNNTGNKVVISARGAYAGYVNRVLEPYWAGNSSYSVEVTDQDNVDWHYVYYYLKTSQHKLTNQQQRGGIPAVSKKQIEGFQIAIPAKEDQLRVVKILDKFDALVNDLSIGLPAEITARRQQYEYYRDKLLTFKELEAPS